MVIKWPKQLVNDIARRQSVLVLGSGISSQARNSLNQSPKTWANFLTAALLQTGGNRPFVLAVRELMDNRDYLTACELIKGKMGDAVFGDFVRDEFLSPRFSAAPIHDVIAELDSRLVITPNFDKIYETKLNYVRQASVVVKSYTEGDIAESIRAEGRFVLKIHGSVDNPSDMIFTRTEYARARQAYRGFYAILDALAITKTFVFLGCGLSDPDIRLILEDYAFRHAYTRPHYFVFPKSSMNIHVQPTLEKSLNLKFLMYDSAGGHRLLKTAIDELLVDVSLARSRLLTTGDW